ncbi:MAG TPA: fused MFS/spermidine synthase [Chthoniobacterales bacterium]|nr:fused MFS/spermidine synthase [Chthoniobacterales bacterium]
MASRSQRSGILAFVLLLFFASGFSALLYQTIWQRLLGFFSGVDVYSVTITVAAFMGGLGCGSLVGGQLADRLSSSRRLLAFALAEGGIAVFALGSKWLYYDLLYLKWHALGHSPLLLPAVLFISLLLPTFCMGLTLPLLAKTLTFRIEAASSVVGYLYGVNTLGAAIGALVTPWVLMRHYTFPEILQIGAALNAACALSAVLVWRWSKNRTEVSAAESDATAPGPGARFSVRTWMFLYALSGFIALSLEIVWFRLLGILQKSTSFTFPTLLAVFLAGLGVGVIAGVPLARRVRQPAAVFLVLQSVVPLYTALAFMALISNVDSQPFLQSLWGYLGSYEPVNAADILTALTGWFLGATLPPEHWDNARLILLIYLGIPAALIVPSTILMGLSFPVLQKLVQNNPALLGRRVGWLQTMNIGGSMLGALVVGWALLQWVGSSGTLKFLVVLGGIFLFLAISQMRLGRLIRSIALVVAFVLVGLIAWKFPLPETLWAKLHGTNPEGIIVREGASGLAVLKGPIERLGKDESFVWVFSNGIGQSWLPYGGVHTQIGMFGVLLHDRPEDVAVIGLGSGDTVYALAASPHTRQLTCIEIVEPAFQNLKQLAARSTYSALHHLLGDNRVRWLFTDGRAHLLHTSQRYDVIEADALRPNSAYSGNLYSSEYFHMLKARLKPGGIAVSWAPTNRVLASFLAAFPHTIVVDGVAIGGQQRIVTEPEEILRRLEDPFTSMHYARLRSDIQPLIENLVTGKFQRYSPETVGMVKPDLNSDVFPKDEYMIPLQP